MQDEIVTHLMRSLEVQLLELKASRLERTPAANPNAQDLAFQCQAALQKGGREAEAGYRLCEQALEADANNVRALDGISVKFLSQRQAATAPAPRPASSGRTNWFRGRSASIQTTGGLMPTWPFYS